MEGTTIVYGLMGLGMVSMIGEGFLKVIHKGEYVSYLKIVTAAIAFTTVITAVGVAIKTAITVINSIPK